MIIEINDNWRLTSDRLNYVLQRKQKSGWINEAYCNSLPGLLSTMLVRDLRSGGVETLTEAIKRNDVLVGNIQQALSPLYDLKIRPINPECNETLESVMSPDNHGPTAGSDQ